MRRARAISLACALVILGARLAAAQQTQPDSAAAAQATTAMAALLAQARTEGRAAGANVGTGGWFAGGLASGAVLSYIGAAVTYALAASRNVTLPPDKKLLITSQPVDYQRAYESAFRDKVKSKRRTSAFKGGALGASTVVILVLALSR
jgi:hypothetical protein